jgi:hypothetical protein
MSGLLVVLMSTKRGINGWGGGGVYDVKRDGGMDLAYTVE